MNLRATYLFDGPRDRVRELLMDLESVAACLPGCRKLEPIGEDRYEAVLTVGIAAVTGTYQGTVAIADKRPPSSCRLLVEGRGTPGFVKGESAVSLVEQGSQTRIEVAGDVQVDGAIARVGQRLIGSVSKMLMDRFFECLKQRLR